MGACLLPRRAFFLASVFLLVCVLRCSPVKIVPSRCIASRDAASLTSLNDEARPSRRRDRPGLRRADGPPPVGQRGPHAAGQGTARHAPRRPPRAREQPRPHAASAKVRAGAFNLLPWRVRPPVSAADVTRPRSRVRHRRPVSRCRSRPRRDRGSRTEKGFGRRTCLWPTSSSGTWATTTTTSRTRRPLRRLGVPWAAGHLDAPARRRVALCPLPLGGADEALKVNTKDIIALLPVAFCAAGARGRLRVERRRLRPDRQGGRRRCRLVGTKHAARRSQGQVALAHPRDRWCMLSLTKELDFAVSALIAACDQRLCDLQGQRERQGDGRAGPQGPPWFCWESVRAHHDPGLPHWAPVVVLGGRALERLCALEDEPRRARMQRPLISLGVASMASGEAGRGWFFFGPRRFRAAGARRSTPTHQADVLASGLWFYGYSGWPR